MTCFFIFYFSEESFGCVIFVVDVLKDVVTCNK